MAEEGKEMEQTDVRTVKVWATRGKVHRYDTRSGELVITHLPLRSALHRIWQWQHEAKALALVIRERFLSRDAREVEQ